MTKIMMTGATGRIGKELRDYGVLPLSGDVTDDIEISNTVSREKPDILVHLAAVSDVDYCERPENQQRVIDVNLRGTYNVCEAASQVGAKVVMLSTDHVFDGGKGFFHKKGPYKETDTPNPLNFYGNSKYSAEALQEPFSNLYVVRTSYLFDVARLQYGEGAVVQHWPDFIRRSFMYLPHFTSNFYTYLSNLEKMPKLLHLSGSMTVSWYEFMKSLYGKNIIPRKHDLEHDFAPRPKQGGLRTKYKKLFPSYSYLDGIEQMKRDIK
jgi:dTDP-4-dehydrorhamnose reductase